MAKSAIGIESLLHKMLEPHLRARHFGKEAWRDMKYLAVEMLKYIQTVDPSYRIPKRLDKYDRDV